MRGGYGKTFLETSGAASSILDWLSGEATPGQSDGGVPGGLGGQEDDDSDDEEEEHFSLGRGRRWQTVGSEGGRYG